MEQLYVLGTGNATAVESYNTCFLLKNKEEIFLVDAGGGNEILKKLKNAEVDLEQIHHIFISHKHMDHCLGLLWIIRVLSVKMEKGSYSGKVYVYGDKDVLSMLDEFCRMTLQPKFYGVIGRDIIWVSVEDQEELTINSWPVTFFDIGSKKTKQLGFSLLLHNGKRLVFTGDEPLKSSGLNMGKHADWLLREVLCCYEDEEIFHAYEKNHDTVKEACELAVQMEVGNLILWHLEDKTPKKERKKKYLSEGEKWIGEGNTRLYIPDDGEVIEL